MTRGQEENVGVSSTSGLDREWFGEGQKELFCCMCFSVDKGNGAVEEGGNSGGGREQWRMEVSDRESEGGSGGVSGREREEGRSGQGKKQWTGGWVV